MSVDRQAGRIKELEHTVMLLIDARMCQRGEPNHWWQGMIDQVHRHAMAVLGPDKVDDRPAGSFMAEYLRGDGSRPYTPPNRP